MSTKAIDIIRPALRRIGAIGATEQPSARQIAAALDCLNGIVDTWSVLPQTAPRPVETVVTLPANTAFRTIGPGAQIDIPRPARIESAYARAQGLDVDIEVAPKPKYDAIDQKTLGSTWPQLLWYDQGSPTGKVYFWPLTDSGIEIHITTQQSLTAFADANAVQELPGGYLRALQLALAVDVAPSFQLAVGDDLARAAATAFDALTPQNLVVPDLDMDGPVITTRKGQFIAGGAR